MRDGGVCWFVAFSYRYYIAPKGMTEHLKFVWQLPGAVWRYWRCIKTN